MIRTLISMAIVLFVALPAAAKNVDLSTVPARDTVQLTIYNSEDLTLVRETRKVSFKRGDNPLQFSWANTLIDPTSVELRFVTHQDKLEVASTTYPHDKPQMLYWHVRSDYEGEATIEITYFTSGISWSADYVCIADEEENAMRIESFVRVTNKSGEQYEDAQVRLVVGTINLVEKIAQLARVPMGRVDQMREQERSNLRVRAARQVMESADAMGAAGGPPAAQPKGVIKEGLSEYFIYTIEGTETIPDGWSKRLRSFDAHDVPIRVQYRYRSREYGDHLARLYLLTNDEESELGETPLPDGQVRVFRENGRGGLSFVAGQQIPYVPIGDKVELNLGPDPQVIFELVRRRTWRTDIWMRLRGADVLRKVEDGAMRIDVNSSVAGWNEHVLYAQRIRNYTGQPIEVEVRRRYDGHVTYRSDFDATLHDYQTVQYSTEIAPGERAEMVYEVVTRQGTNAKQNNVTLEGR